MAEQHNVDVLAARVENITETVSDMKIQVERMKEQINALQQSSVRTETYVSQIFMMLDDIKTNLKVLGTREENNRDRNNTMWLDWFKLILGWIVIGGISFLAGHSIPH